MTEELRLTADLEQLSTVASSIITKAKTSPIVVFRGDLGAGKTTLIKNICNLLHVTDEVNSPTFSIVNEYRNSEGKVVYHFDFYRIEEEEEALDIGCEDYFYSGNLCLIEWPSKVESLLPENRIEVMIEIAGDKRMFIIN